ncbi:class I SAM-dependent methyltransferase, partial [Klebsiella pneumoniae]
PEDSVGALGELSRFSDKDIVELGCGTAYFSAWFARLGARPVGVDITPAQLENARRFQEEFRIQFPLIEANAEDTGLPLASFDFVFSEYGASIWCD